VLVVGAYFWRHATPLLAVAVTLLVGLSPDFVSFSVAPLSDVPFCGLVWATILLVDRPSPWTWKRVIGVTGLAGAAILFRPHGLVLVPALLLWGLLNQRRLGWWPLVPGLVLSVAGIVGRSLVPGSAVRPLPSIRNLVGQFIDPTPRYHFALFESHLYPFPGNLPNDVYHVLSVALMLIGLFAFARSNPRRFSLVFTVIFALALASLRAVDLRYAWPLYPLFVFGLVNGVRVVFERVMRGGGKRFALAFASLLAVVTVGRALAHPPEPRKLDDPAVVTLFQYLQTQTAEAPIRVAFIRPRVLAWKTGIHAMPLSPVKDPQRHLEGWCEHEITHVVLGDMGLSSERGLQTRQAIESDPDRFDLEYRNGEFEVYGILPGSCPG
jgi:hypothetical protein